MAKEKRKRDENRSEDDIEYGPGDQLATGYCANPDCDHLLGIHDWNGHECDWCQCKDPVTEVYVIHRIGY